MSCLDLRCRYLLHLEPQRWAIIELLNGVVDLTPENLVYSNSFEEFSSSKWTIQVLERISNKYLICMYVWAGLSTLPRDLTNKRDSRLCRVNLSCSWEHARAWPGDTWASTESAQVSCESSLLRGFRHHNLFDLYLLLVPLSSLLGGLAGTLSVNGDIISCHRIGSLYFVIPSRLGIESRRVIVGHCYRETLERYKTDVLFLVKSSDLFRKTILCCPRNLLPC